MSQNIDNDHSSDDGSIFGGGNKNRSLVHPIAEDDQRITIDQSYKIKSSPRGSGSSSKKHHSIHRKSSTSWWTRVDRQFNKLIKIETSVADTEDFPKFCKWISFLLYATLFCTLGAVLFYRSYVDARTKSFITLDRFSGECADDPSRDTCCEVPASITGTYLVDDRGNWNTETLFSHVKQIYAVSLTGLRYNNDEWKDLMNGINKTLKAVGVDRGTYRDISWNLVSWASFTAVNKDSGTVQFYTAGSVDVIFDKDIYEIGYASMHSDDETCNMNIQAAIKDGVLSVTQDLNQTYNETAQQWNCQTVDSKGNKIVKCGSPCPGIFTEPQMMGYDNDRSESSTFTWTIDMASVLTALAVNMKIIPLSNLEKYENDTMRIEFIDYFVGQGLIDSDTASKISSYFELLFAPTDPVYCIDYEGDGTTVSCLVRVHYTLFYPVMSSYGYPYLLPFDSNSNTSSFNEQTTSSSQKKRGRDRILDTKYEEAAKRFQASPVVQDNPEIISGDGAVPSPELLDLVRSVRFGGVLQEESLNTESSESEEEVVAQGAKKMMQRISKKRKRKTLLPTQFGISSPVGWFSRLVELSIKMAEPVSTDDGYTIPSDPTEEDDARFVMKQCNIVAYVNSQGHILDYCDVFDVIVGLIYYPFKDRSDIAKIFSVAKSAAYRIAEVGEFGDIWAQYMAYDAMISTLIGDPTYVREKQSTFRDLFGSICSPDVDSAEGCAMFALDIYGAKDRTLSVYEYQPMGQMAFKNSLYDEDTMERIAKVPPTRLTQSYYSCIMTQWEAAYAASGLAASNTQLYGGLFLIGYMYLAVYSLQCWCCAHYDEEDEDDVVHWKAAKLQKEEKKQQHFEDFIVSLQEDIRSGRLSKDIVPSAYASMHRYEDEDDENHEEASKRKLKFKRLQRRRKVKIIPEKTTNSNDVESQNAKK